MANPKPGMPPRLLRRVELRLRSLSSRPLVPASEKDIARIESYLGAPLPASLGQLLRLTDGFYFEWGSSLCGATHRAAGISILEIMRSRRHRWPSKNIIPIGLDGWNHFWCIPLRPDPKGREPVLAVPMGGRRIDYIVASSLEVFLLRVATIDSTDGAWRASRKGVVTHDPAITRFREFCMPWRFEA